MSAPSQWFITHTTGVFCPSQAMVQLWLVLIGVFCLDAVPVN